jgi:hypothetical protein
LRYLFDKIFAKNNISRRGAEFKDKIHNFLKFSVFLCATAPLRENKNGHIGSIIVENRALIFIIKKMESKVKNLYFGTGYKNKAIL